MLVLSLRMPAQTSATVQALESTARERLAARDTDGALAAYEKLASLVSGSAAYQDEIGFLLAATNRSAEAIPHFRRATELDPKMAQAWYHLGVALWLTKSKRIPPYAACSVPLHWLPIMAIITTAWERRTCKPLTTSMPFRNWDGPRKTTHANAGAWATLGDACQALHRYGPARDAYRQALRFDPKNDSWRNSYGNALVRSGDPTAGMKEFRAILAHDPGNLAAQVNVGFAYIAVADFQGAIRHLR